MPEGTSKLQVVAQNLTSLAPITRVSLLLLTPTLHGRFLVTNGKKKDLGPGCQRQVKTGLLLLCSLPWMTLKDNEEGEILLVGTAKGEVTREENIWTPWEWRIVWLTGRGMEGTKVEKNWKIRDKASGEEAYCRFYKSQPKVPIFISYGNAHHKALTEEVQLTF